MSAPAYQEISNHEYAWLTKLDEVFENAQAEATMRANTVRFQRLFGGWRTRRVFNKVFAEQFLVQGLGAQPNMSFIARASALNEADRNGLADDLALRHSLGEQILADQIVAREVQVG